MVAVQDLLKAQTRREGLLEEYKVAVVAVRSHPGCDETRAVISSWMCCQANSPDFDPSAINVSNLVYNYPSHLSAEGKKTPGHKLGPMWLIVQQGGMIALHSNHHGGIHPSTRRQSDRNHSLLVLL